ncbi:MAG: hypothetical protein IAE98_02035 [Candidatus Kapabacteria bacterium]|jgi:hypothetical protein|nr:hypothetical protein [Candidatus Kapabacteria bacterium]MCB0536356.1 hypothetical protein [Bacteroidota bacterium]
MKPEQLLILHHEEFCKKASSLIDDLKKSKDLRQLFAENPTAVVSQRIMEVDDPDKLIPQRVSKSNRFLYSVLANKRFYKWLTEYQAKLIKQYKKDPNFDKTTIYVDFINAFAKFGNPDFVPDTVRYLIDPNNPSPQLRGPSYKVTLHIYVAALIFLFLVIIDISIVNPGDDCKIRLTPSEIKVISDLMTDYADRFNNLND